MCQASLYINSRLKISVFVIVISILAYFQILFLDKPLFPKMELLRNRGKCGEDFYLLSFPPAFSFPFNDIEHFR